MPLGRRLLRAASPTAGRACLQSKRRPASQCTSRGHRGRTAPSSTTRPLRASVAPAELPRRHRYCHLQARRRKPGSLRRTTFRFVGNCAYFGHYYSLFMYAVSGYVGIIHTDKDYAHKDYTHKDYTHKDYTHRQRCVVYNIIQCA